MSITNINDASSAAAQLPSTVSVKLSSGCKLELKRLSWLAFEALWPRLAGLLSELWHEGQDAAGQVNPAGETAVAQSALIAQHLASVPGLLVELLQHCCDLGTEEIAELPLCDVLALAAAALRHNFIETAGLRDFFGALSELAA